MRTIKFRAWDTIDKRMRYENDVEGIKEYPSLLAVGFHGLPICISPDSFKVDEIVGWNRDHNLILMQYTGLKDKNSKEIYEGDILFIERWNRTGIVHFQGAMYRVKDVDSNSDFNTSLATFTGEVYCEIIGNIYKDPELIEVSA